jgi:hypothetical protein
VAYGISVFPFAETASEFEVYRQLLVELGVDVPEPAVDQPRASELREAMTAQGCDARFWPDASSWFCCAPDDISEDAPAVIDGIPTYSGAVGSVGVQFERGVGTLDWTDDWSDRVALYSFDRPDLAAVLHVVGEMARRDGPQILGEDGTEDLVAIEATTTLGDVYAALIEAE